MINAYVAEQRRGFYLAVWREPVALFYFIFSVQHHLYCMWLGFLLPLPLPLWLCAIEPSNGFCI